MSRMKSLNEPGAAAGAGAAGGGGDDERDGTRVSEPISEPSPSDDDVMWRSTPLAACVDDVRPSSDADGSERSDGSDE